MKCNHPLGHSAKGECLEGPTGDHMHTLHSSQDKDEEGLDEHEEQSQREEQETREKE